MNRDIKLIGHDNVFINLVNLLKNKNLPNKILLQGNKGIGKFMFADHFVNYVLSLDEECKYDLKNFVINNNNKSQILNDKNVNPNIFKIQRSKDKKFIDVSQIRDMIKYQNKSSFNNKFKFILINDVGNLNLNSSNALLKSLEEPNNNVFFILTHNLGSKIEDTIKSRCINFKLFLKPKDVNLIVNNYFDEEIIDHLPEDFINHYNNPSFIISLIIYIRECALDISNITVENLIYYIIENKDYIKNKFVRENINIFIELFFFKKVVTTRNEMHKIKDYFYRKFNLIQKYNLDLETFFLEFKKKLLSE